jgi:hypothetical protein
VVIIVAIVAVAMLRMARYRALGDGSTRTGRVGRRHTPPTEPPAELVREIAELKQRLAVLERIATDDRHGRAIAHEIEQLRDR